MDDRMESQPNVLGRPCAPFVGRRQLVGGTLIDIAVSVRVRETGGGQLRAEAAARHRFKRGGASVLVLRLCRAMNADHRAAADASTKRLKRD